jgi:hypothetical protein
MSAEIDRLGLDLVDAAARANRLVVEPKTPVLALEASAHLA